MRPLLYRCQYRDGEWSLNLTRHFYLTNHHYVGERKWYMRLGKRPGRVFVWGKRKSAPVPETQP